MPDPAANRVIVVGAGPVGLVCALSLASRDVPVLLLEANDDLFMDLRAGSFHPPRAKQATARAAVSPPIPAPTTRTRVLLPAIVIPFPPRTEPFGTISVVLRHGGDARTGAPGDVILSCAQRSEGSRSPDQGTPRSFDRLRLPQDDRPVPTFTVVV